MKQNNMEIAPMTEDHVARIAELERICFSDPWSENSVASELTNELSLWLVVLDGEKVAAYVGSQSVLGEADMMNVAVFPEYRRRGIGEQLVLALVKKLAEAGNYRLSLEVRVSNQAARALYEKLGFRQAGLRPGYYRKPREDGLILRKEWEI